MNERAKRIRRGARTSPLPQVPARLVLPTVNSTRLTVQTALIGVNYKFNLAGPVIAKY